MYIEFANKKLRKICEDADNCRIKYGIRNQKLIFQRVQELRAAKSLKEFMILPGPKCHKLNNDRHGQYGVSIEYPKRLILLPILSDDNNGAYDENMITSIQIVEIVDYHK